MKEKLRIYGFPDFVIEELLKGKVADVNYGKVKLNKRTGKLITYYHDGQIKENDL